MDAPAPQDAESLRQSAVLALGHGLASLAVAQDAVVEPGDAILILTGAARALVAWTLQVSDTPDEQLLPRMADTYDIFAATFAALATNARRAIRKAPANGPDAPDRAATTH